MRVRSTQVFPEKLARTSIARLHLVHTVHSCATMAAMGVPFFEVGVLNIILAVRECLCFFTLAIFGCSKIVSFAQLRGVFFCLGLGRDGGDHEMNQS